MRNKRNVETDDHLSIPTTVETDYNLSLQIIFVALLLAGTSCKSHKNPSLSENSLVSEMQSTGSAGSAVETDNNLSVKTDDHLSLHQGIQYKEVRSVDPNRPPVVFHFTDGLPKKEFKLSEIATQLEYTVVKTSRDSSLYLPLTKISMGTDYIFCYGINGIELFDIQGNYIKTIVKNDGLMLKNGVPFGYSPAELTGFPYMHISVVGNNLIYCYLNGPTDQASIMQVDPATVQTENTQTTEIPLPAVLGTTIKGYDGKAAAFKLGFFPLGNGLWVSEENKWESGNKGDLLTLYGPTGDTICQFKDYDRIQNYPGGPYRNTDQEFNYHYKNTLSFKPAHNDTLFRVIPPNRLLPAYVFDFGSRKVGLMEGLISTNDLSEKNLSNELFETNRYLFFVYTRNHSIARNIKSGSCKFFFTLIDKRSNQIYHLSDIKTSDGGISNDLDGGVPFWPEGVNQEGIPYMWCSGREFKKLSVTKKIDGLADNDLLIIKAK